MIQKTLRVVILFFLAVVTVTATSARGADSVDSLIQAIIKNNETEAIRILTENPEMDFSMARDDGGPLIQALIFFPQSRVFESLFAHQNIRQMLLMKDSNGFTTLFWAAIRNTSVLKSILSFPEGKQLIFVSNRAKISAAHAAAAESLESLKIILAQESAETFLTMRDESGDSILHSAIKKPEILDFLLDRLGENSEIREAPNNKGHSPLGEAIRAGRASSVAVFAKHKFSLKEVSIGGRLVSPIEFLLNVIAETNSSTANRAFLPERVNLLEILVNHRLEQAGPAWESP